MNGRIRVHASNPQLIGDIIVALAPKYDVNIIYDPMSPMTINIDYCGMSSEMKEDE